MSSQISFALLVAAVTIPSVIAQPPARKDEPKLKVGDPAPPLTVGKWYQGPEVTEFEKGKVYVIAFWGLFKGDSHALLRTVGALQSKHKEIVPVAVGNSTDGEGRIAGYAKAEADVLAEAKPKYPFAFVEDKGDATAKSYGVNRPGHGLYVIGKDGKIAFVAPHDDTSLGPMLTDFLPDVLPKVLDGSWRGQKDAEAIADAEREFQKAIDITARREVFVKIQALESAKRSEATAKLMAEMLKDVDGFLTTHPSFASQPRTLQFRATLALANGQKEVLTKAVDGVVTEALARGVVSDLVEVAAVISGQYRTGMLNPELPVAKLMDAVADAALQIDLSPWDLHKYGSLMQYSLMVGNREKARALLEKRIAGTPEKQKDAEKKQ